jgi:hypothetical protein
MLLSSYLQSRPQVKFSQAEDENQVGNENGNKTQAYCETKLSSPLLPLLLFKSGRRHSIKDLEQMA